MHDNSPGFYQRSGIFLFMTKQFLILAILLMSLVDMSAQKIKASKVPEKVMMAFRNAQPTVRIASWSRESTDFRVDFKNVRAEEVSLLFSAQGVLLETEIGIDFSELPRPTQNTFKGNKLKNIQKVTDRRGKVTYKVGSGRKQLRISSEGRVLNSH